MQNRLYELYSTRKATFSNSLSSEKRKSDWFSWARLVVAAAAIGLAIYSYYAKMTVLGYLALPLVIAFIGLVLLHQDVKNKVKYYEQLVLVNERSLQRLAGKWTAFAETGEEYLDADHPYADDLNIFGKASLYQYLLAASTAPGKEYLSRLLSSHFEAEQLANRQGAVQELAEKLDWRQRLEALGRTSKKNDLTSEKLNAWASQTHRLNTFWLTGILYVLPGLSIILILLARLQIISPHGAAILLIIQLIIVGLTSKKIYAYFSQTEKASEELHRLAKLLRHIETESFYAPLLQQWQRKLQGQAGLASNQIKRLAGIGDWMSLRYSPLIHFPLNVLFLLDLHTLRRLEAWKAQSASQSADWLQIVGKFEALSSLAGPCHDNPQWAFPTIKRGSPFIEAAAMGHPLIHVTERVANDVSLPNAGSVLIITGSNMSGKSTYLRTIGVNLVLAYAGAPVCAASMNCSFLQTYTSMRIRDDLEQGISTFYAELQKVKSIIDAAKQGQHILFLIDEIFKGTNSRDRIAGAKAVIRQLANSSAVGLITTHDVELGSLEQEKPGFIRNHHFIDRIVDGQLRFDYELQPGVSQTTNALALMQMVGIDC